MSTVETSLPTPASSDVVGQEPALPPAAEPPTPQSPAPQEEPVDSALLAAMRDPRERLGLLKLEQAMMEFMKQTTDNYLEIGGYYNSMIISPSTGLITNAPNNNNQDRRPATTFQRCILHRLADRFAITRESATMVEGYIRVVKGPDSSIPKQLLVDLDPSEYTQGSGASTGVRDATRAVEQITIAGNSGSNNNNNPSSGNNKPRKMKIMKRDSSGGSSKNSSSSKSLAPRKGKNLSDKEKAYAEARARIFGKEEPEEGSSSTAPVDASVATTSASSSTLPSNVTAGSSSPSSSTTATAPSASGEDETTPAQNSNVKATYRNRQAEESDPDFRRGRGLLPTAAAFTPSAATIDHLNGYGYGMTTAAAGRGAGSHLNLYQQQHQQGYASVAVPNYYAASPMAASQSPMYGYASTTTTASPQYNNTSYSSHNPPQPQAPSAGYTTTQRYQQPKYTSAAPPKANVDCLKEFPTLG